jgi:hypothetical protein
LKPNFEVQSDIVFREVGCDDTTDGIVEDWKPAYPSSMESPGETCDLASLLALAPALRIPSAWLSESARLSPGMATPP